MIIALADAAGRPGDAWAEARRSKFLWLVALTFGVVAPIFGINVFITYDDVVPEPLGWIGVGPVSVTAVVGVLLALRYFLKARPQLAGSSANPGCLTAVLLAGTLVVVVTWVVNGGPPYPPVGSPQWRAANTPSRVIDTPRSISGFTRDDSARVPGIRAYRERLETDSGGTVYDVKDAVYIDGGGVRYVFVGGRMYGYDPGDFLDDFRDYIEKAFGRSGIVTEIDPGPGGGAAACGRNPADGDTICEWVTEETFGQAQMTTIDVDTTVEEMAEITRRIRAGVEKTGTPPT
ncbi:hypothetical protein [Sphaerisporangium aureirubrum]|uniref:Uncharacterized protein n=1 Tax=Sphaerisporangium aureirubrum TaxID=1544736 RepID=A0ABW1NT11_9ACTN